MAVDWYLMDKPPLYNGGFERDEFLSYAQMGFQELLDTTMLSDRVEFINSDFSVINEGLAVIQNVTPDTQLKYEDRQILTPIGTLQPYSYVRHDGNVWLIASEPSNNKFYEKSVLKLCRNQLRWQDPTTKEIREYWYWSEDSTKYSSGVYEGTVVVQYDKQYSLMLPMDANTRKLHDGMRFMFELSNDMPLVYELTKFDGMTGNDKNVKILKISVTQTVYDKDRDNVELMIADYYDAKDGESEESQYTCELKYDSQTIAISSFQKYYILFDIDEDVDYTWSITDNSFDIDNLTTTITENCIKISVKNNQELVDETFTLNAVLSDGTVLASLPITIISLW